MFFKATLPHNQTISDNLSKVPKLFPLLLQTLIKYFSRYEEDKIVETKRRRQEKEDKANAIKEKNKKKA